jgi:hypothetical protein
MERPGAYLTVGHLKDRRQSSIQTLIPRHLWLRLVVTVDFIVRL